MKTIPNVRTNAESHFFYEFDKSVISKANEKFERKIK